MVVANDFATSQIHHTVLRQRKGGGLFSTAEFNRVFGVRQLQIERLRTVAGEDEIDVLRLPIYFDVQSSGPGDLGLRQSRTKGFQFLRQIGRRICRWRCSGDEQERG
jgi:hypothetical protein